MTLSTNRPDFSAPQITSVTAERGGCGVRNAFYAAVVAMAGHDLRQPLQVIVGAHDCLARNIQGDAERVYLSDIKDAATQLVGTFDRLVDAL